MLSFLHSTYNAILKHKIEISTNFTTYFFLYYSGLQYEIFGLCELLNLKNVIDKREPNILFFVFVVVRLAIVMIGEVESTRICRVKNGSMWHFVSYTLESGVFNVYELIKYLQKNIWESQPTIMSKLGTLSFMIHFVFVVIMVRATVR